MIAGNYEDMPGFYTDSLQTFSGCDSLIITELIVLPSCIDTIPVVICEPETYLTGGAEQSVSGFYIDTLMSSVGTDSILVTDLTVHPQFLSTTEVSICEGDSILLAGDWQTTGGLYTDSLVTINGCDSVINYQLTINPILYSTVNASICEGESYFLYGEFVTVAGTYLDTLDVAGGCAQVVTTILEVHEIFNQFVTVEICDGDEHFVGGANQTAAGFYVDNFTSQNNCDSIITTELIVHETYEITSNDTICTGEIFTVNGIQYTTTQVITDAYQSINGCDSIHIYNLEVIEPLVNFEVENLCEGDGVVINNEYITETGIFYDTLTSVMTGCDSINIITVNVWPNVDTTIELTICSSDSILQEVLTNQRLVFMLIV